MKNYYKILEVEPSATPEQIKAQHKLLLHAWHPDKFPEGDLKRTAHEKTLEINEAFSVLGNPSERFSYDQKHKEKFQSTYSTDKTYQSRKDGVNTDPENETSSKTMSVPDEYVSPKPKNTPTQFKKAIKASVVLTVLSTISVGFKYSFGSEFVASLVFSTIPTFVLWFLISSFVLWLINVGSSRKCNGCMIEHLKRCFETQGLAWTEIQFGHGMFDLFIGEGLKV